MAGVLRGECMRGSPEDESLTLTRCYSCGLLQLYEALGWKSVCCRTYNLKGIKGKISFFPFIIKLCFSFTVAHFHGKVRASPTVVGGGNV